LKLEYLIEDNVDIGELRKAICFLSEDICDFKFEGSTLLLEMKNDSISKEEMFEKLKKVVSKYKYGSEENQIFLYQNQSKTKYYDKEVEEKVFAFDDGMICLQDKSLFLFRYFIHEFQKMDKSIDENYEEKVYPVLLPVEEYQKTGYIKRTPQYALFCCSPYENIDLLENLNSKVSEGSAKDILKEPEYSLSPSACFHTYIQYKNKVLSSPKIISFTQNVFRNEGRLNYSDFGRLRDYHVREIVFIGDTHYVECNRRLLLDKTITFLKDLDLDGDISVASDPFILPKMQKFKKIQLEEKSKYELHLYCNEHKKISVASFNLHGKAFTDPFHIKVKGVTNCQTGCIGFGIERWILAFLSQYGFQTENWPAKVREEYEKNEY